MRKQPAVDIRAMLAMVEATPMTRAEIARQTGLTRATITRLAKGDRGSHPPHATVVAIKALQDRVTR